MILEGKIIDFLGDSITEGVGVLDKANNRYDNVVKRKCNLKAVYNYGISGTRFAYQSVPSENPRFDLYFCGRAYDLNPDADIIVVYGGINDFLHGDAPIGTDDDKTPETFCGAVEFLMSFLKNKYEGKTVVFMTPAHCYFDGCTDKKISPHPLKKTDGIPVAGYVDIIIRKGGKHGIPVLNLFETLGIDPNKESDRIKYAEDGLHFNDAGHAILAERLIDFLEKL